MWRLMESVELAVLKDGLPVAGVECADWKDMFEPGDGGGRRGVRLCVGNWDSGVERGRGVGALGRRWRCLLGASCGLVLGRYVRR